MVVVWLIYSVLRKKEFAQELRAGDHGALVDSFTTNSPGIMLNLHRK